MSGFSGVASNQDTSASVTTATGPVNFSFNGVLQNVAGRTGFPTLKVWVRTGGAGNYLVAHSVSVWKLFRVNMNSGDQWYTTCEWNEWDANDSVNCNAN